MTTKKAIPSTILIIPQIIERIPASWRYCIVVWSVSRLYLCAWGMLLWTMGWVTRSPGKSYYFEIQPIFSGAAAPILGLWLRWDAVNYLRIAANGIQDPDLSGFFPLFPLLGRWISQLFGTNIFASLMVIANLALLVAMVLLYRIVEEDYPAKTARYAVLAMVSFPGAVFFYAAYPHSLALALILGAYWAGRRSQWPLAFILGCLSGLAHPTVLPVFFLLGYRVFLEFRAKLSWPRLSLLFIPFSALAGSGIYLAWRAGAGFRSYTEVCREFWGIVVIYPWQVFSEIGRLYTNIHFRLIGWVNLLVLALAVFMLLFNWKKIPWEAWFYQSSMLAYYLSFTSLSEPFTGFTRLTIMMFPQFMGLGILFSSKWARFSIFALFWILQLYLLFLFFSWIWIG